MARTGANYSIKVGVDLDTSDIQKQLREAAKNNQLKLEATGAGSVRELTDAVDKNQESIEAAQFSYQVANQIFRTTIEIISSMIDQVYELDGALTEFKKVSDLTGNSLTNYVGKLSDLGKTTARTTSEMVEAATTFRKNSFSDEDSARLAQVATMYQNVADTSISAADAASFIISQMKAFKIEAANASDVIDKVNKVANNMAVGTNDLSSALEVAGAGLSTYNNSFEQTIGLT